MHPSRAERYRHVILALAFLAVFTGSIPAFSVGTLAPLLRTALHLTREQLGWLTALFYAGTALVCIPAGLVADRFGVRFPLVAVQVAGGLSLLAILFLYTYSALLLVMFLVGIAYGTVTVITAKAVSEWFPRMLRATALGVRLCALPVSGSLAGAVVPGVALWGGWRQAFAVFGGLMLASAGSHLLLYRDCPQTAPPPASLPPVPSRRSVFRDRNIWLLAATGFLFGGVRYSSTAYLALFLHEGWGVPLTQAASLLAQAHLASAPGFILYGLVSDRWLNGERKGLFCVLGAVAAAALLAFLLLPQHTPTFILEALIVVYGLSGLSWGGLYQTLSVEVAGQGAAGVGIGITVSLMYAGTTATAPLFGHVVDMTGSYTLAWGLLILWLGVGVGFLNLVHTEQKLLPPNSIRKILGAWRSRVSKPSVPQP
jgi:ACS family hexuronate transporter-like MFS transporter